MTGFRDIKTDRADSWDELQEVRGQNKKKDRHQEREIFSRQGLRFEHFFHIIVRSPHEKLEQHLYFSRNETDAVSGDQRRSDEQCEHDPAHDQSVRYWDTCPFSHMFRDDTGVYSIHKWPYRNITFPKLKVFVWKITQFIETLDNAEKPEKITSCSY